MVPSRMTSTKLLELKKRVVDFY